MLDQEVCLKIVPDRLRVTEPFGILQLDVERRRKDLVAVLVSGVGFESLGGAELKVECIVLVK